MNRIIVFGTGSYAIKHLPSLALNYQVIAFCDNFKTGNLLNKKIVNPKELNQFDYDLIVICSTFFEEISKQLIELNIQNFISIEELPEIISLSEEINKTAVNLDRHYLATKNTLNLNEINISNAKLITNRKELLAKVPTNSVGAELGVAAGDFTKDILEVVSPQSLHLVDIWGSERYGQELFLKVSNQFSSEINSEKVFIHRNLSTEAAEIFSDKYFDWIYIDTDHSYDTTYKELILYKDKVKDDGLILGHDYTMGNWVNRFRYGVMEAVHNFCVEYNYEIAYLTMDLNEGQSFAIKKII